MHTIIVSRRELEFQLYELLNVTALASAKRSDHTFYKGKLQACRYFFRWELPKCQAQNEVLRSLDATCLKMRDEWF